MLQHVDCRRFYTPIIFHSDKTFHTVVIVNNKVIADLCLPYHTLSGGSNDPVNLQSMYSIIVSIPSNSVIPLQKRAHLRPSQTFGAVRIAAALVSPLRSAIPTLSALSPPSTNTLVQLAVLFANPPSSSSVCYPGFLPLPSTSRSASGAK